METISDIALQCFDSSNSGIVISSCLEDFPIIYCNDAFCTLTGYERPEIIGENCRFLQGEETNQTVVGSIKSAIAQSKTHRIVIKNYRKDGAAFWNDLYLTPIRNAQGSVTHYLGIQNDIKDLDRNNRNVPFHFPYDDLTQLPTPAMAVELIKMRAMNEPESRVSISLGTISINGLANLRGFMGNSAADMAILEIRDRLQAQLDECAILARAGEGEFIIIVPSEEGEDSFDKTLERLCESTLRPVRIDGQMFQLTFNGGFISRLPYSLIDESTRFCSFALAQSQDEGRNRVVEFTDSDLKRAQADQLLAGHIPTALQEEEFYVAYQPQLHLETREVVGFEALARWEHPEHGIVSPGRFIPLCENSGYINALTLNLLEQICHDLPDIWERYGDIKVSLNLSPFSLLDREFIQAFIDTATAICDVQGKVSIEVVENLSIDGYESAAKNLAALREAGFDIILDDFGTGYSSLSYIRSLGASVVKIDREFVMNLNQSNHDDLAIIRSVVSLGQQFGFDVIAEGIEYENQAAILLEEGVTIGQGYFFSKPLKIAHFL
ncbi:MULTISPECIES: putative bifunctional diguanylate cyclase/phosphodiesterase [unclassified Marinobacter]|uniref:putative bifunctional diguanylate cyclase/phosphodiesterase n=1 Tax=unclassified Marinobacter TaxID=83889 RepID=UPI001927353E|nr:MULTISPECIES: EAL domain-containing protein [unclassified Marinobacter]MBL3824017.1 EAL domain-containing protein [Marinobacter sp. MC3]MBL3892173.1 EAL domain-containing protein [Marinobacter sp. MW3]